MQALLAAERKTSQRTDTPLSRSNDLNLKAKGSDHENHDEMHGAAASGRAGRMRKLRRLSG
jgi:hypothetical protein